MKKYLTVCILCIGLLISSSVNAQETTIRLSLPQKRELFTKAVKIFQDKQYEESVQYFERLLNQYPELQDYVQFFLANAYIKLKEDHKALVVLQKFLVQHPSHPLLADVRFNAANLLFKEERYNEAIAFYTILLDHPEIDQGTIHYQRGRAFLAVKNYKKAVAAFHNVIAFYPRHSSKKEAERSLQKILKEDPKLKPQWTEETLFEHANALLKARYYTSAIEQYQAFKTRYPKSSFIEECEFGIVDAYFRSGKTKKGMDLLEQLIVQYGTTQKEIAARALYTIGSKHWNADRNTQAARTMQRIAKEYAQTSRGDNAHYVLGRIYQGKKQYEEAAKWYEKLYATYTASDFAEESLWRAGWSYYLAQQYEQAEKIFLQEITVFPDGSYYDDGLYWLGRTCEKLKKRKTAIKAYRQLGIVSPDTYYGILTQRRLRLFNGIAEKESETSGQSSVPPHLSLLLRELNQAIQPGIYREIAIRVGKVFELQAVTLQEYAAKEVEWIEALASEAEHSPFIEDSLEQQLLFTYFLGRLYAFTEEYLKTIQLASKLETLIKQSDGQTIPYPIETLKFPLAYWELINTYAQKHNIDPFLVTAIIRQESAYAPKALSYANARGLMQIIPKTGRLVAKQIGVKNFKTSQLYDPETNIMLGTKYIANLLEKFDGNLYRAIAAYNAGPKATDKWWPEKGIVDHDVVVENITYRSTRRYVKHVIRNQHHYRKIYSALLSAP